MPDWLRIRNEGQNPVGAEFFLQWDDPNYGQQSYDLGFITFETSQSFQLSTLIYEGNPIPDGSNCWVACGTDQSESNFTIDWSDNFTAAYNYGFQGFSLNIEPNN
jgi:hypothetical protein